MGPAPCWSLATSMHVLISSLVDVIPTWALFFYGPGPLLVVGYKYTYIFLARPSWLLPMSIRTFCARPSWLLAISIGTFGCPAPLVVGHYHLYCPAPLVVGVYLCPTRWSWTAMFFWLAYGGEVPTVNGRLLVSIPETCRFFVLLTSDAVDSVAWLQRLTWLKFFTTESFCTWFPIPHYNFISFRQRVFSTPAHSGVLPIGICLWLQHASLQGPSTGKTPRYLSNNFTQLIANLVWLPPLCFRSWWV